MIYYVAYGQVSIPFREDLYSDIHSFEPSQSDIDEGFPSLSGKTSIRTWYIGNKEKSGLDGVSIPFREDLYSDT